MRTFLPVILGMLVLTAPSLAGTSEDCLRYDPSRLSLRDAGSRGWAVAEGPRTILLLDDKEDARQALALARRHTHRCFIGRDNQRRDRDRYIVRYWKGKAAGSARLGNEDCLSYSPEKLEIRDLGRRGWQLVSGRSAMLLLDDEDDAWRALDLAQRHTRHCFIGRDNRRADRDRYIVEYWDGRASVRPESPERYAPGRSGTPATGHLQIPERGQALAVQYEILDGLAVFEGDMILGTAAEMASGKHVAPLPRASDRTTDSSGLSSRKQYLIVRAGRQYMWPNGIVPYEVDGAFDRAMQERIDTAIQTIQSRTNLRFRPGRDAGGYVRFKRRATGCAAFVGRHRPTYVYLSQRCSLGSVIHEILHAAGMWHEQSRNDRDAYVRIHWDNIKDCGKHNFYKHDADGIDIGPYDYSSIMHYDRTACGLDRETGQWHTTIEPLTPGVAIGQRVLSRWDVAGINSLYPLTVAMTGGQGWGAGNYATDIAFGDVDGDGRDEVGVVRKAGGNERYWILDDAVQGYRELLKGGQGWGSSYYATSIAFGDVDGDGRDEVGITRKAGKNARYWILDAAAAGFNELLSGGQDWGSSYYATSIAFGDLDGDGRDEIGIARRSRKNARFWILDDRSAGFRELAHGGQGWGSSNYATSIAFGDVDGDGRDEVGVARKAGGNARYFVLGWRQGRLNLLRSGGHGWGSSNYATSIAFGDVDGDGRDEVGVGRRAGGNHRYLILDDHLHQFRTIRTGGEGWGSSNYATSIAFGDVDRDGRDEVGIARKAGGNERYWLLDDSRDFFQTLEAGGRNWGSAYYATSIAFGDVDGDGDSDFGTTRKAAKNMRYCVFEMSL